MNFAQKLVICSFIFIFFNTYEKCTKRKLVYNAEYGMVDCGFEPRSGQTRLLVFVASLLSMQYLKEKEQRLVDSESG